MYREVINASVQNDMCLHSGKEVGPMDGIEGVRPVVGEHYCVGWVGSEGGVDGVAVVFFALDADPELRWGE
jgi:hypothetical protein